MPFSACDTMPSCDMIQHRSHFNQWYGHIVLHAVTWDGHRGMSPWPSCEVHYDHELMRMHSTVYLPSTEFDQKCLPWSSSSSLMCFGVHKQQSTDWLFWDVFECFSGQSLCFASPNWLTMGFCTGNGRQQC